MSIYVNRVEKDSLPKKEVKASEVKEEASEVKEEPKKKSK